MIKHISAPVKVKPRSKLSLLICDFLFFFFTKLNRVIYKNKKIMTHVFLSFCPWHGSKYPYNIIKPGYCILYFLILLQEISQFYHLLRWIFTKFPFFSFERNFTFITCTGEFLSNKNTPYFSYFSLMIKFSNCWLYFIMFLHFL